jgi:hypothetical protein
MDTKDIDNPQREFENLGKRFSLLHNRFLAVAMDYKYYIDENITDYEIYTLRDNVLYRLHSAIFHFQLLIDHHTKVENRLGKLYSLNPSEVLQGGFKLISIQEKSTKEIYALFDSMIYHLCSIFDYIFRLINYIHGQTILDNPKWNKFRDAKNLRDYCYCSKEIIPKLQQLDTDFIYPLIKHRSHLIHTENDMGDFKLNFDISGKNFNAQFKATKLFKENFKEIDNENQNMDLTIKFVSFWLIDKTLKTTTDLLFELRDDMIRNKKIPHGMFAMTGPNNTLQSPSAHYWGDRNEF